MSTAKSIKADYKGYDYEKKFWESGGHKYEDLSERAAISKLLPKHMNKFADIYGGYGRLAKEYLTRTRRPIIFDLSQKELAAVKERYGEKVEVRAGDIYNMPFRDGELDGVMLIRVTRYLDNLVDVTNEIYRVLEPGGAAIIEIANKRTIGKIANFMVGRSKENPFNKSIKQSEKDGIYDYHPKYAEGVFERAGFKIERVLSVSNFNNKTLEKVVKTDNLVKMESAVQSALAPIRFASSIYYKLRKPEF